MSSEIATIIAASIAAFVAMSGWFVSNQLTSRRDDRTKRLELTIAYTEKQIGEFYAPLLGLIEQLDSVYRVKQKMCEQEPYNKEAIETIAYKEYFFPIHQEIIDILKHKLHLLEGLEIPQSVIDYFHHFASENMYWRLTKDEHIASSVTVSGFPSALYDDLRRDLDTVYRRYEDNIRELRH